MTANDEQDEHEHADAERRRRGDQQRLDRCGDAAGGRRRASRPRCRRGGARRPRRRRTRLEVRLLRRGRRSRRARCDRLSRTAVNSRPPGGMRRQGTGPRPSKGLRMDATEELPTRAGAGTRWCWAATGSARGWAPAASAPSRAHDERLDRMVAVKVDPGATGRRPSAREREALAAARLDHPGIVALLRGRRATATPSTSSPSSSRAARWPTLERDGALSDRDVAADRARALRRARARARARRRPPRRQAAERDRPRRAARRAPARQAAPTSASPTWPATSR